jgi:predicted nucleic acid-binding protein
LEQFTQVNELRTARLACSVQIETFASVSSAHGGMGCGAEVLYSEEMADGRKYGGVRVVNPLG